MIKKALLIIVIILAILGMLLSLHDKGDDEFTVAAITTHHAPNALWEGRPLTPEEASEVDAALKLKYTYYAQGGQSFAFFSEGEKYVLKFFKQKRFHPPSYLAFLPSIFSRYKEKKVAGRVDKLERDFISYTNAFNDLKDLTGLLYIHLNPTEHLNKRVFVVGQEGKEHMIDIDKYEFILQKRAFFVVDEINKWMRQGDVEAAQRALCEQMDLVIERAKRGYRDRDPNIDTNCGFINDKAVKIDVGHFVLDPSMKERENYSDELKRTMHPFKKWLQSHHPSLMASFEEALRVRTEGGAL